MDFISGNTRSAFDYHIQRQSRRPTSQAQIHSAKGFVNSESFWRISADHRLILRHLFKDSRSFKRTIGASHVDSEVSFTASSFMILKHLTYTTPLFSAHLHHCYRLHLRGRFRFSFVSSSPLMYSALKEILFIIRRLHRRKSPQRQGGIVKDGRGLLGGAV